MSRFLLLFLLLVKCNALSTTSGFAARKHSRRNEERVPRAIQRRPDSKCFSVDVKHDSHATSTTVDQKGFKRFVKRCSSVPRVAVQMYGDYAKRLWNETSTDARRRIANDKAGSAIRAVEHLIKSEEYVEFSEETDDARHKLLEACQAMLIAMEATTEQTAGKPAESTVGSLDTTKQVTIMQQSSPPKKVKKKKNKSRSVLFGVLMGVAVATWVFSGNYIFTVLFTLMTILGQLEYYRMVMNTGVYPARRISVIGACSMFLTALFAPNLHQICLPMFGLWAMVWFLTMRRRLATIPEIATTFTGMFYLGYVPSFWVRIRIMGAVREPTRLASIAGPFLDMIGRQAESLPASIPLAVHLPVTAGAVFIFWTWLCLAFSDVGAYYVGKNYGKTKLSKLSPAAGSTSPNKSVEGVLGGCAVSAALGMVGAWVQKWPYWPATGAIHGCLLALLGLIGDLTASMLKRDAGMKDFGDLLPEHGGIMDRVDSFVWSAPYSWLVYVYILPFLKKFAFGRTAIPV